MINPEKKCLVCKRSLEGRIDKKFCDSYCRNLYNRNKKRNESRIINKINKKLKNNRSILKFINPTGKSTVCKTYLIQKGFDFQFFTNIYQPKNGNTYYICYDYGFRFLDEDKILIVEQQSYWKFEDVFASLKANNE